MPLVRIDLAEGTTLAFRKTLGEIVHHAMLATLDVPKDDQFQIFTEHSRQNLIYDRDYLGVHRSEDCIFLQITLNRGRSIDKKQAFYKTVAEGLQRELNVRKEDVFISLVEVNKEDWSFGNGEAQYVSPPE